MKYVRKVIGLQRTDKMLLSRSFVNKLVLKRDIIIEREEIFMDDIMTSKNEHL